MPAADAQRRQPTPKAPPAQLAQQRDDQASAGRADRMPKRDGAAVYVDPAAVELAQRRAAAKGSSSVQVKTRLVWRLPALGAW